MALRHATVAVFPSYAEAFAFAPLESMAQGCPTVYSTRGSGTELIRDGQDGILVDPDRPAEIAAAILRLLRDPALARRMGAAGRARVAQEFSLDVLLDRNVTFYRACIDGFRERS
jgi:glycosyltransferase involved in cell wall biosynthesis